jgi:co-chaperonin GroES (HSP10)
MPCYPIKPIGKNLLVKRLTVARKSNIYLPDEHSINIFLGLILDTGKEVEDKIITPNRIGYFDIRDVKGIINKINGEIVDTYYIFEEKAILLIRDNKGVTRPFGRRALVWRNTDEVKENGIWIPACYQTRDQTKKCFYYRPGVVNGEIVDFPCLPGDKIELKGWDMSMREIQVDDKYMLSVNLDDIVYKET